MRNPEPHQSLEEIRDLIRAARGLGLGDALGGHSLGHAAAHAHLAGGGSKTSLPLEFNEDDYMVRGDRARGKSGEEGKGLRKALRLWVWLQQRAARDARLCQQRWVVGR